MTRAAFGIVPPAPPAHPCASYSGCAVCSVRCAMWDVRCAVCGKNLAAIVQKPRLRCPLDKRRSRHKLVIPAQAGIHASNGFEPTAFPPPAKSGTRLLRKTVDQNTQSPYPSSQHPTSSTALPPRSTQSTTNAAHACAPKAANLRSAKSNQ